MRFIERSLVFAGAILAVAMTALAAPRGAASPEYDPVRRAPVAVAVGPEAARFIVGLRATAANAGVDPVRSRPGRPPVEFRQAHTRTTDAADLAGRVQLALSAVRQLTPSMHLLVLQKRLYGADIDTALKALRADPAVRFAAVDERRYAHAIPDDPLFAPTAGATGQWFMATPDATTPGADAAATDAVSAWDLTTGSTGTVIADVDTGVLFGHPDLGRAGLGGRLLPGYDFVSGDLDPTNGTPLGTFLIANDGDGWDPDPSDPGDWIDASDQSNALFPTKTCAVVDSSWHGTRVMGILGALTNNGLGIAGMTWSPMLLPVRALGKCGGYDSDIISGMQWAVGLPVTGVPNNPFPAQIVNLSLGSTGACPASYQDTIAALGSLGVLVVASAGNEGGAVDAPANCAGVLGVAGLRNIGTKVGYSSFGAQVSIAAPAGNCVNGAGLPCLRPIDTLTSTGLTVPGDDTYTNQANPNLGTSFSAPIVSGIAGLMRAVNANLTPSQLIARIQAAATAFPEPAGTPVCPATDATTGECACPNDGSQCGAGMANAHGAVLEAQRPIAAVALPASSTSGAAVTLDGSGSAAACGRSVAAYAWAATGAVTLASGAGAPQVSVVPAGAGSITLTVTDSLGAVDVAMLAVDAAGVISAGAGTPAAAGNAATACPAARLVAGTRRLHRDHKFAGRLVKTVLRSLRHSCRSELTRQGISLP